MVCLVGCQGTPQDAQTARNFNAQGIGLCRTEHMFFDPGRLTVMREMIFAETSSGRAAVLVPYPFAVDDHQTVNARFLTDQGAAYLLPQNELTTERLAAVLGRLLGDRAELHTLAQAACRLARPDATRRVADVCEQVIA